MFKKCNREKLGEYILQVRGVSYKPKDLSEGLKEGFVTLLRANNIANNVLNFEDVQFVSEGRVSDDQIIREGDILICASSGSLEHVGKAALCMPDMEYTFGAFCKLIRPIGKLYPEYIAGYMRTDAYRNTISDLAQGSNINNLRNEHINDLMIPIPSDEQQRDFIDLQRQSDKSKSVYKVRVLPPPRTIVLKKIWHEYSLEEKSYTEPVDFKLSDIDYSKYESIMYEKDSIARESSLKEKNVDYIKEQMKFSEFSLVGEVARYLNISCVLINKIIKESVDGVDVILDAVNKYNEILDDVIIPGIFHSLFEVKAELRTEDKELVLLREPKDAGYYEFSAKDELVVNNQYKAFTQEQIAKSFHADTYCFDSAPEKECFMQYITNNKVKEVFFVF